MNTPPNISVLAEKIQRMKTAGMVDLSTEEDLSIAVMNLISLEEHFFFTGEKTGKKEYFNLLDEVRQTRKELLARLIPANEGETWCISKHLLATTMRLMEVGTKLHADGKKGDAEHIFARAHSVYTMFWGLRLKLIDITGLKHAAANDQPWTLQDIVDKLVDCCDEK